ncbi:hypothetical protein EJ04DRAFT_562372 [Polyplosphaeria fusca]|uniref:Uncharacterized protein n=1 Tax=Polyplosphaeria fusca TaxID=682080 RepID=A0A9P4R481_9PLEO|nr:hypothetical protein EJ04DRAFT_562372 [Polyplosphaeria fusca]
MPPKRKAAKKATRSSNRATPSFEEAVTAAAAAERAATAAGELAQQLTQQLPVASRTSGRQTSNSTRTIRAFEAAFHTATPRPRRRGSTVRGGCPSPAKRVTIEEPVDDFSSLARPQKKQKTKGILTTNALKDRDEAEHWRGLYEQLQQQQKSQAGRNRLQSEVDDDDDGVGGEDEDESDGDGGVYIVDPARRRRETSSVGPARTLAYSGAPLSRESLMIEQGKKDLQREFRERGRETPDTWHAQEWLESGEIDCRTDRTVDIQYVVQIQLALYVNKLRIKSHSAPDKKRSEVVLEGLGWLEERIQAELADKVAGEEYTMSKQLVTIKSPGSRIPAKHEDIEDFGEQALEHLIDIADQMYFDTRSRPVALSFDVRATCPALTEQGMPRKDLLRLAESASPVPGTPGRNDRTKQLKAVSSAQKKVLEFDSYVARGDFIKGLYKEWKCEDQSCMNHNNYCYHSDERPGQNFKLSQPTIDVWAAAMERADTEFSLTEPSRIVRTNMYNQGAVSRGKLESKKLTVAERRKQLEEEHAKRYAEMELRMRQMKSEAEMDRLLDQKEVAEDRRLQREDRRQQLEEKRQEREERRQRLQEEEDDSRRGDEIRRRNEGGQRREAEDAVRRHTDQGRIRQVSQQSNYTLPPPYLSSHPLPHAVPLLPSTQQPSSLVESLEDDLDVVGAFFEYMLGLPHFVASSAAARRARIEVEHARDLSLAEIWTLEDVRTMSSLGTTAYELAKENKIPSGIINSFKRHMKGFKSHYRQVEAERLARRDREQTQAALRQTL